jgi:subtilisin family serine protease
VAALDWVTEQHKKGGSNAKSVANLSVGGEFSEQLNSSVQAAVAAGVVVVTASGNSNSDACKVSPASEPTAITVGSTDRNDVRSVSGTLQIVCTYMKCDARSFLQLFVVLSSSSCTF